ncbi:MAG: glutaredoxin domain-containing protein [Endomicrobiales bacterium]
MSKSVTIYTTPSCGGCIMLKTFLKDNAIAFEEIDVSSSSDKAQEAIRKSGQISIPLIDIDGKIIVGFDQTELVRELGLNGKGQQK